MEFSGDSALAGGVVSALVVWLVKLLVGRAFGEVSRELVSLRQEVSQLNKDVAFIRGRMLRRGDDRDHEPRP